MKDFTKIVKDFHKLNIFTKSSILDVSEGFEYTTAP